MQVNLAVQWTNKLFEITSDLGQYTDEDFFGLFWGEQQPFVSSGYGGLYFLGGYSLERCLAGEASQARQRSRLFPFPSVLYLSW
jgi:hypothetical protein